MDQLESGETQIQLSNSQRKVHLLADNILLMYAHTTTGDMYAGADPGLERRGFVRPALEERALGGSGGMPPRNFLDFRPSEIVAGAIWGRNTRPPHLLHLPCS